MSRSRLTLPESRLLTVVGRPVPRPSRPCRRDPPDVATGPRFAAWMCRVHNAVNRRLDKPTFNCDLVGARWAPLDCDEHNSCDLTAGRRR